MDLEKWFAEQAQKTPTAEQKLRVYQRFLDATYRSISYHKISYYSKIALFSLGLIIIGGTAFYSALPRYAPSYDLDQINDAYVTLTPRDGNYAQATTLGKIISAVGTIEIVTDNEEETIDQTQLQEDDRVILSAGAEMRFQMAGTTEAKIVGPAVFELEKRDVSGKRDEYVINLISGDYLEVVSLPEPSVEVEKSIASPTPPQEKKPSSVVVQAPTFSVAARDAKESMHIVISTDEKGAQQLENNGAELVVKKFVEDKQTFVAVKSQEKVAIDEKRITFLTTTGSDTTLAFVDELEDHPLAVEYAVSDEVGINALSTPGNGGSEQKVILDAQDMKTLSVALNSSFIEQDKEDLALYSDKETSAFLVAYGNLLRKLQTAYTAAGYTYTSIAAERDTFADAAEATLVLKDRLVRDYYIPPELIEALNILHATFSDYIGSGEAVNEVTTGASSSSHSGEQTPIATGSSQIDDADVISGSTYEDMLEELADE